jgi:hypothetical protein
MGEPVQTIDSGDLLENWLKQTLRPVQPDPVFIHRLQKRLTVATPTILEQRPGIQAYLYIALGLFFGVLVVWVCRRVFAKGN